MSIELHEQVEAVPKVGDLWVHAIVAFLHHQIRFFLPSIDMLFASGNRVVKIEHSSVESKVLVWRLGRRINGKWKWNFEHKEKLQSEGQIQKTVQKTCCRSYGLGDHEGNHVIEVWHN